jgi:hypothetical protein
MISLAQLNKKLELQSKFLSYSLNISESISERVLAQAIYSSDTMSTLHNDLLHEFEIGAQQNLINHQSLKYLLICETEDSLLIKEFHTGLEEMAKNVESMVDINFSKLKLFSMLYELFGLGDESKYIISASADFSLDWQPCYETLADQDSVLGADFKINNVVYRILATKISISEYSLDNFNESISSNLKQVSGTSEAVFKEGALLDDHKDWLSKSTDFFTHFDSYNMDEAPNFYKINGERYVVYGFILSPHLQTDLDADIPSIDVLIKNISDKQTFIINLEQQRLVFEALKMDDLVAEEINYCHHSMGVKHSLLTHCNACKFPLIINGNLYITSIRPYCDIDFLVNAL